MGTESEGPRFKGLSIHKSAKLCVGVIRKNGAGKSRFEKVDGESRGHGAHLGSQAGTQQ